MADQQYELKIERFEPSDPRLGRHVVHDSRSLRYRYAAVADLSTLASVRHKINIPILDQGQIGSCTGHAGTAALASDAMWGSGQKVLKNDAEFSHQFAVNLYSAATKLDPWPGEYQPTDTGSDGLSIAKALLAMELISGYQHATSLNAALSALAEKPVIIGSSWLEGMFDPASDGRLTVSGTNEGGHEYCLDELDVERQRVWMRNSWSATWGVQGRAWMSWTDLGNLLADQGDCTIFVPRNEPPPQPTPIPPAKPGVTEVDTELAEAMTRLLDNRNVPGYMKLPGKAWLEQYVKNKMG